jgi:outer membrane protein TolC
MLKGWVVLWLLLGAGLAQTLSYQEALNALALSPRLRLAQGQVELAERQLAVTGSILRASVSGGISRTWGTRSGPDGAEAVSLTETSVAPLTVAAALNVIPFGPRFEATLRASWQLDRARLSLRDEWYGLIIELTEGFQNAVAGQLTQQLQQEAVALARLQLEAAQTRFEAGAATSSEVQNATIALQQAEQELLDSERQALQTLASLSLLLGQRVEGVVGTLPPVSETFEVDETRLSERSDVIGSRLQLEDAELTRSSTLRENLPSGRLQAQLQRTTEESRVALGASYGIGGTESYQPNLSLSFDPDPSNVIPGTRSQSFTVGVEVTIPLDTALPDALEAARLSLAQAELQLEQTLALARLELENRQLQLEGARANLLLAEQVLAQRQASLRVSQERFALGVISQLELAQAELNVREAELAVMQAAGGVRLAAMQVARSLAINPLEVF